MKNLLILLFLFLASFSCVIREREILETRNLKDCTIVDFNGGKHVYLYVKDVYDNKYEIPLGKYISCPSYDKENLVIGKTIDIVVFEIRFKGYDTSWLEFNNEEIENQICNYLK